ncbi:macrolide ABC transporter ATP-binding protein, partial [Paenibacillus sp. 28ISP30-2]|nr:macrolide ABC transporter ATP-binding protein [Paenibacillus sp. 28ISP30-2]
MEIFQRVNDRGKTVVLVTHDQEIAEYAKRLIHFRDGRIDKDQPVGHLRMAAEEVKA